MNKLNKDFALTIVLLFFTIMSLSILGEANWIEFIEGFIVWSVLGTMLLVLYAIRFKRKDHVSLIDYIKLALIMFFPFVSIHQLIEWENSRLSEFLIIDYFVLLIIVYLLDRFIIKPPPMKKRFVIALIIESVIVLLSLTYAFVQTSIAKEARNEAMAAKELADQLRQEAEKQRSESELRYNEIAQALEKVSAELERLKAKK